MYIHTYIMSKEKNCRLCLELLDDYCIVIEEGTREIFEFLLLKVDISISEEPVVCKSCMESIQAAFNFKSTCIFVNEQIVSLARDRNSAELDIRDVYLNKNENKDLAFNEDYNICRFCLQCLEKFKLLNDLRNNLTEKKLLKCIPELEMNIIKEPVVCTTCLKSLEAYYNFAVKCQNIEENIMKYCEVEGADHNGQISLSSVLKFLIKGMPECIDNCSKTSALEENDMFQNEGNTYSDINNIVIKIEEDELIIKDENMYGDCEPEENRCGESSRKEVVNYDMVTHKNSADVIKFRCVTKQKRSLKVPMPTRKDESDMTMYECNLCNYKAKLKSYLNDHMLTHKDSDMVIYRCEKCMYRTKYMGRLNRHVINHKDSSEMTMYKCNLYNHGIYRCEKCTFKTRYKTKLKSHMLTHKDESKVTMYKCNLRNYETKRKYELESHNMLTHKDSAEEVMYRCEKCTFVTERKRNLKEHVLTKHMLTHENKAEVNILTYKNKSGVTIYKCNLCNFVTKLKYYLGTHMSLIHKHKKNQKGHMLTHENKSEVTIHKCNLCNFETKWKYYLGNHMLLTHNHKRKEHMLTHKYKLKVTMVTHKDESEVTMHKCNLCNFETKWKSVIRNHLIIHEDPSDVIMYRCEKCTFETKYKNSLKMHTDTHEDKSEVIEGIMYNCNLCSYKSNKKDGIRSHLLTHKDFSVMVMYRCEKCTFETKYKSSLKMHMDTHKDKSEVVMHNCNICSYKSKWRSNLGIHLLTHR